MPQLFDPKTGQPVQVSPEEAHAGLVAGTLGLDADAGPVSLLGKDGKSYSFEPQKVSTALATGAYRLPDAHEELAHQVAQEERAKGLGGSIVEGLKSAGNQALFGLPGALQEATETPEEREKREAVENYHHVARLLGGAVGVGASLLTGGELFKGAELAGQAVERGVLPAEELAQASLAHRLAGTAANYATQGAALASPQALIQGVVGGDWKKAAETLGWGIGTGAVLGGAGSLASEAGSAATGKLGELLGAGAEGGEGPSQLDRLWQNTTAKNFGAQKSQIAKLGKGRVAEVTDFAHEVGLTKPDMSRADLGKAVELAHDKYGARIGEVIDSLDGIIAKGTENEDMVQHAIRPGELGDAIKTALDSPELRMPMNADQANALDMVVDSANKMQSTWVNGREVIPFETAQKFVSRLRKKWVGSISRDVNEGGIRGMDVVTPLDQMKSAAYQSARDAVNAAADRVATASNKPELIGALFKAKGDFSKVAELEKWTRNLEAQETGNRKVSLTDFLHMGSGIASGITTTAGAALGGALAGPAGAVMGASAGKLLGIPLDYFAKHWVQDRGMVVLSHIARAAAKEGPAVFASVLAADGKARLEASMQGVRDTVKQLAIRGASETADISNDHMKHLLGDTTGLSHEQQFGKLSGQLEQLASNPAAMAAATAHVSAPFAAASPELGAAYQAQMMQTLGYLYQALPKNQQPALPFAPTDFKPGHAAMQDFRDKAEIVANPMAAMKHLKDGTLSDAHIEALSTVWGGAVYPMMKAEVLKFAAEHPDVRMPYPERRLIAKFLGAPTDGISQHVMALQAGYTPAQPPPSPASAAQGKPMGKGKLDKMPSHSSAFSATQAAAPQGAT
jgi:hypothetical protein